MTKEKPAPTEKKPHTSTKELTPLQEVFVLHYVANGLKDGAAAAKAAGYKGSRNTLAVRAAKNLKLPHVRKAVMEEFDTVRVQAQDVLLELWQLASSDLGDFFEVNAKGQVILDYSALKTSGNVLKSIKQDKDGNVTIQLHGKETPLKILAQHLGIAQGEGVNVSVNVEDFQGKPYTDQQVMDQAAAILEAMKESSEDADSS